MTDPSLTVLRPGAAVRATALAVPAAVLATCAIALAGCAAPETVGAGADAPDAPLAYVATAEQVGPVAYRDPLGAVSPDGVWFAYTERDRVHVAPVGGGAVRVMGDGAASIRSLAWLPDSRRVAALERVFDRSRQAWFVYDRDSGERTPLWPGRDDEPTSDALDMLAWSPDGASVAAVTGRPGATTVWGLDADGGGAEEIASGERLSFPAWGPAGAVACLSLSGEHQRLHLPCSSPTPLFADQEAYGPIAFSPDGREVYYGAPGEDGFLDLWARASDGSAPRRLARFERDAYAPSVAADGRVFFKSQEYRVSLATAPAAGGASEPLTTFQSETPSWSWDGLEVAFTFGSWRHVTDDFHYPDIAQHIGVVDASSGPHAEPGRVVRSSYSEDQAMTWSPNGRWIAFHTHEESDDIWLVAADGSTEPRMISEDGNETGWARWSADGRWIVFPSYRRGEDGARRAHLFVIGVDQESGEVTAPQARVELEGFDQDVIHGEWADGGETLVFESAEAVGSKSLWRVPRAGGRPELLHRYGSDQVHSGIGISADALRVAYVDRAPDGVFQIFAVPVGGGPAVQLTSDPAHKTQPAYSPAGDRVAFTVFDYRVHFWSVTPR